MAQEKKAVTSKKKSGKKAAKKAVTAAKPVTKTVAATVTAPRPQTETVVKKAEKVKQAKVKKEKVKPVKTKKAKAKSAKVKPTKPNRKPASTATVLSSKEVYVGRLFRVLRDRIVEPSGVESDKDIIRHNGSVVILAVDQDRKKQDATDGDAKKGAKKAEHKKKDPWLVIERQYRHAAGQYLWELPAGKLEPGEDAMAGAKRELAEETGYAARNWSPLVEYFASPGFLGESMKVFLAEGLVAGEAHPEEDEQIDFRLVRLSEALEMIDKGRIIDGKTLTALLVYARRLGVKRK